MEEKSLRMLGGVKILIFLMQAKISNTLLPENYTVILLDIQSRSFGPFVLEQPSAENDYTVILYLSDSLMHGYSWWKFELYYIPRPPEELGLAVPWESSLSKA